MGDRGARAHGEKIPRHWPDEGAAALKTWLGPKWLRSGNVETAAHRLYCSLVVYPFLLDIDFAPSVVRTPSAVECASSSPWIMRVRLLEPKLSVVLQTLGRLGLEEHLDEMLMLAAACTHADLRSLPPPPNSA